MAARRGTDDEGPRREREEVEPDYARGQTHEAETPVDGPDFARGQRRGEIDRDDGDVAEGQAHFEDQQATADRGDFARGQRQNPGRT